jgi:sodium/potassium-transporting ATPase subunit alpha
LIFDNLKKTIAYTLTHLWPEIAPVAINLAFGLPAGLTSLQILSVDLFTELGPAISLAYEGAERDIMRRPPRDLAKDKLMTSSLILYSYLIAGMIEFAGCFLSYASAFWIYGISLTDVYNGGDNHWKVSTEQHPTEVFCSGGKCFDETQQLDIIGRARGSWYVGLVIGQFFNIWMCKTRRSSVFKHGFFSNSAMIYGTLLEVCLVIILVYVPGVQEIMGAASVNAIPWVITFGAGMLIWGYSETIKWYARSHPGHTSRLTRTLAW